jgi:hypothetical protein
MLCGSAAIGFAGEAVKIVVGDVAPAELGDGEAVSAGVEGVNVAGDGDGEERCEDAAEQE